MTKLFELYRPKIMTNTHSEYKEYLPNPLLRPYVTCYWTTLPKENLKQHKEYTSYVIPDGCTDIIFQYNKENKEFQIRYCGIFESYFEIKETLNKENKTFGIRFFPGGSYPFIYHKAKEVSHQILNLDCLNKDLFIKLQNVANHSKTLSELVYESDKILLKELTSNILNNKDSSSLLNNVLYQIFSEQGKESINDISKKEVTSSRKINRLFEERIGISPKKFSQVIRFQSSLMTLDFNSSLQGYELTDDFGFYDQSHFIRDFKKRIGKSPSFIKPSDFYNT